jgi:cyclophilin family peptidyl-prolyl cis-trans isomerase
MKEVVMVFNKIQWTFVFAGMLALASLAAAGPQSKKGNPTVIIETSMGKIVLELNPQKAPVSVENFLAYVKAGFYDGTIFHRVIKGFMIQGGGYDKNLQEKTTRAAIMNEAGNGLKNTRGTISYARTSVIHSATSQFFINHADNAFLDHQNETDRGFGYAVFGKVIKGMDIVDQIASVETGNAGNGMADVPKTPVLIIKASLAE